MTIIGASLTITGEVTSNEDVTVHGKLNGKITMTSGALLVAEKATVAAEAAVSRVKIEGAFTGDVAAKERVELSQTAVVNGTIVAPAVVLQDGAAEWQEWLDSGGLGQARGQHATEFRLHAFRSAEALASLPELGELYRQATDLALPHFGATLLLAGAESTLERLAMTFGDRDFHLGLAELALGFVLRLGAIQCDVLRESGSVFNVPDGLALEHHAAAARQLASRRDRCVIEQIEVDGEPRQLVSNWRRQPGSTPLRVLL